MKIGVLAIQGSFSLHRKMLEAIGAKTVEIRRRKHLNGLDGVIIPGGESTTFQIVLDQGGIGETLKDMIAGGLPAWGTCAGAILIGRGGEKPQPRWELIDIRVTRNAFGRQVDSFVAPIRFADLEGSFSGVFIRAPIFSDPGDGVTVISEIDGNAVAARQRNILVTAFHPELTSDDRIHRYFLENLCNLSLS